MRKPTANAKIIVNEHRDFRGGLERLSYQWVGGNVICISYDLAVKLGVDSRVCKPGDVFCVGPYRLRIVWRDPVPPYTVMAMRVGWVAWGRIIFYAVIKRIEKVYRRLILTAAVWGLAEYDDAVVPTWRDLYMVKWMAGLVFKSGD